MNLSTFIDLATGRIDRRRFPGLPPYLGNNDLPEAALAQLGCTPLPSLNLGQAEPWASRPRDDSATHGRGPGTDERPIFYASRPGAYEVPNLWVGGNAARWEGPPAPVDDTASVCPPGAFQGSGRSYSPPERSLTNSLEAPRGLSSLTEAAPKMRMLRFQPPGQGTGTPVHKDGPDNLVLQLQGVKRWTIFPPSDLQAPRAQLEPTALTAHASHSSAGEARMPGGLQLIARLPAGTLTCRRSSARAAPPITRTGCAGRGASAS